MMWALDTQTEGGKVQSGGEYEFVEESSREVIKSYQIPINQTEKKKN